MGKDKLRRFEEFRRFRNTYDFPYELKGKWNKDVFKNNQSIVLELGCGKGEYAVALGREFPGRNFIGIDIKSNRMWKGAGIAEKEGLKNVAFLRTLIDKIDELFDASEVEEIWITFPDPFPKYRHSKHRLLHPRFLSLYKKILKPGGIIHLKTDDTGLFHFVNEVFTETGIRPEIVDWDVHHNPEAATELLKIRTHYENIFMNKGLTIKYTRFTLDHFAASPTSDLL